MSMHLYCAVSSHGFGHISQTAPILNALAARLKSGHDDEKNLPELCITLQCAAPKDLLAAWFHFPFRHIAQPTDLGLLMHNAVTVDISGSFKAYQHQLANWEVELQHQVELIAADPPDLILTNNSYLVSAAAGQLHIPCLHFSSLNWAALFQHYCHHLDKDQQLFQHLVQAYNQADAFLCLRPGLPMQELANVVPINPVTRHGRQHNLHRVVNNAKNHDLDQRRFVLVSMGGIAFEIPFSQWPEQQDICWILTQQVPPDRPDMISIDQIPLPFIDILASCDAVVIKPGYGMFVESIAHHKPMLFLARDDWPETPYLKDFADRFGQSREISAGELASGALLNPLLDLLQQSWEAPEAELNGVEQSLVHILKYLPTGHWSGDQPGKDYP